MKMKNVAFLLFTFLLTLTFALPNSYATLGVGDTAPAILLDEIQADGSILNQDILKHQDKQKFTIVDFSSYNCGPCIKNLPNLKKIAQDMAATTTVRWVNTDRDKAASIKFWEKNKSSFIFPFSMDLAKAASKAFAIQYTPTMFVIDQNNKIIHVHIGTMQDKDVEEVEKMLQ